MISPAIAPDKFTWSRVVAIMKLMLPRMRTLLLVSLIIGLMSTIIVLACSRFILGASLVGVVIMIPAIAFYVSPVFIYGAISPRQFVLLPATVGEKLVALLIPVGVVGIVTYYLPQITTTSMMMSAGGLAGSMSYTYQYMSGVSPVFYILSYLSSALPAMVCLYSIISSPGHRWQAIALALVTIFIQGIVGGLYVVVMAIKEGYKAGLDGRMPDTEDLIENIFSGMMPFMWAYVAVALGVSILFVCLTYRKIATLKA
ncbi:MAG: hypothetical protein NC342_06675 [Pseudoflavonifractor sp.]|nr:hypothetical protein [Alloprevotella sp.]MCM1117201.1 hypothetical protein [Pseudoflavonifractor sp.]